LFSEMESFHGNSNPIKVSNLLLKSCPPTIRGFITKVFRPCRTEYNLNTQMLQICFREDSWKNGEEVLARFHATSKLWSVYIEAWVVSQLWSLWTDLIYLSNLNSLYI
jgi:hypothetical protein